MHFPRIKVSLERFEFFKQILLYVILRLCMRYVYMGQEIVKYIILVFYETSKRLDETRIVKVKVPLPIFIRICINYVYSESLLLLPASMGSC